MAATGTKAGAEKARATRAAKRGAQEAGTPAQPQVVHEAMAKAGTAGIAAPMDRGVVEALRTRRDKGAAKERAAKLPDHGRHVAPQGLHRLPAGFRVKVAQLPRDRQHVGAEPAGNIPRAVMPNPPASHPSVPHSLQAPNHLPGKTVPGPFPNQGFGKSRSVQGLAAPGAEVLPAPVLTGGVHLDVATFLGLAERAGLTLTDVASLARTQRRGDEPARAEATSARRRERNLSPVALKAQRALQHSAEVTVQGRNPGPEGVVTAGPTAQWAAILEKAEVQQPIH
jgi:hypothetical protein